MRLDAGQVLLPAQVLAVDLAQVSDEESILVTDATQVVVNSVDAGLERVPDQVLGVGGATEVGMIAGAIVGSVDVFQRELKVGRRREERRCHAVIDGSG
jgi:NADPH:quinone reductase-like Zn-dependent oxidoreductase